MAGSAHPVSQLDVLDLRPGVSRGVEAARRGEDIPAHGAAASPEGLRVARTVRVHVMMQQVPVLREEPGHRRARVVRAEDGGHTGLGVDGLRQTAQGIRMQTHIRVEEDEPLAPRRSRPEVPRVRGTTRRLRALYHGVGRRGKRGGTVGARVVHYDELPLVAGEIALPEGAQRLSEHGPAVVHRHDDGESWRHHDRPGKGAAMQARVKAPGMRILTTLRCVTPRPLRTRP